jgi:hypothetical protein
MPIIRRVKYRTVPSGKSERAYHEMALAMRDAGESALTMDLTKVELSVLRFYSEITHLTIRGGGKKWQLDGLPQSIQDLCLLEVEMDTLASLETLTDLRVFDHRLGNIRQTEGLEKCPKLQVLHFLRVAGLNNLEFLPGLKNLEWIKISECMNVKRFPDLNNLPSLRRVIIERCQGLIDVSAFNSAPNLEDLIILESESIKSSDFKCIAACENPRRVLPGIGKLGSPDFIEASNVLTNRATSSYYGGRNEFLEIRHRKGGHEFSLKIS